MNKHNIIRHGRHTLLVFHKIHNIEIKNLKNKKLWFPILLSDNICLKLILE